MLHEMLEIAKACKQHTVYCNGQYFGFFWTLIRIAEEGDDENSNSERLRTGKRGVIGSERVCEGEGSMRAF